MSVIITHDISKEQPGGPETQQLPSVTECEYALHTKLVSMDFEYFQVLYLKTYRPSNDTIPFISLQTFYFLTHNLKYITYF